MQSPGKDCASPARPGSFQVRRPQIPAFAGMTEKFCKGLLRRPLPPGPRMCGCSYSLSRWKGGCSYSLSRWKGCCSYSLSLCVLTPSPSVFLLPLPLGEGWGEGLPGTHSRVTQRSPLEGRLFLLPLPLEGRLFLLPLPLGEGWGEGLCSSQVKKTPYRGTGPGSRRSRRSARPGSASGARGERRASRVRRAGTAARGQPAP